MWTQKQNCDQVWHCHQAVADIRSHPDGLNWKVRCDKDRSDIGREIQSLADLTAACQEREAPHAVEAPSDNRRKPEQQQDQHDKSSGKNLRQRESGSKSFHDALNAAGSYIRTGAQNDQARHCTYDQRVKH